MLKLTDDGAHITLTSMPASKGDGMFWFGFALLVGAIGVAMAMSLLPERLAIGALGLLVVGSFIFNWQRTRIKKAQAGHITGGELLVHRGSFVHQCHGVQNRIVLSDTDSTTLNGCELLIIDQNNQQKCQITGFETAKEAQVMQAVLQGQQFGKRHANIKMQSN